MSRRFSSAALVVAAILVTTLLAGPAQALVAGKDNQADLAGRSLVSSRTSILAEIESADGVRSIMGSAMQNRWEAFRMGVAGEWQGDFDKRSGRLGYAEGAGIPWVPGRGNSLGAEAIVAYSRSGRVDLEAMEAAARAFMPRVADLLGVDPAQLHLNLGRSGQPASHVWFVDFDVVRNGLAIEGARVVFRVNNGNLIQFGTENLPAADARMPARRFTRAQARQALGDYLGGFEPGDRFVDRGSLHLVPVNVDDAAAADGYRYGEGRGLALVWQFSFRREGQVGTWQGRVDATSGEVMEFFDANQYGSATGGTYPTDSHASEPVRPLPFANVATGVYTNSAGVFSGTTGTTTLNGQYVRIVDSCGSISKAADASGVIALGTSGGTDCTTPGTGGAGNTHSARTQFYGVNRAKEVGRGWLPSNSWLSAQLTVNVNLNQTCNAYWNGSSINFFRSGGGCNNTGELPGVSLHEYGHGLDTNDGSGTSVDNGTGETYGDFTAALATHSSCVGNGFLTSNCGGYGNACTSCTGVRDIDWAKHSRNTPSTVANFTQTSCPQPSPNNPNYIGPCGKNAVALGQTSKKREGHCESYVSSEALWDLANRDMPNPGSGAAWASTDRLWYLSRSTATVAFACNVSGTTWTSNGCVTGSNFRTMRAVDDDNGNLNDGTPHGGAIAAAFNRHGIACTTDTGWNVTFAAVTPPAVPTLSVTAGNNSAALSWSGSSGVYDVYRNEAGCNAGFVRVANDVSATSYNDAAVANGFTYYYQVVAQPSGNEAAASAPSTCRSVVPAGAPCTPPAAPTGLTATAASPSQINLSWSSSAGATSYNILRATTSGGPYTQVGTSATTSFSNTGLSCNTTYYYVVQASNGSCSSANSSQAQAATQACTGNVLTNGVPVSGISGGTGSQQFWTINVPAGATNLSITTTGGTDTDADLYVKFGSQPTTTVNDCRSETSSNNESCSFPAPSAGTYHVLVYGYSAYSGVTLTGSFSAPCTPPAAPTGVTASATGQTSASIAWNASSGATSYTISRSATSGGPYSSVGTDTASPFSNTGLSCNTTYYYVVSASNGSCSSGNSAQAAVTTQACSGGTELIVNGGFESGTTPWVMSGAARSTGSYPHSGVAYSYLQSSVTATQTEYQQIAIPTTATGTLTFWLNVTSSETTTSIKYDNLYVEVRNTAGTLLATLGSYSNLDKTSAGSYSLKTFNVAAYKGQTVRIQFRGTFDSSVVSTFRIDDVSVK